MCLSAAALEAHLFLLSLLLLLCVVYIVVAVSACCFVLTVCLFVFFLCVIAVAACWCACMQSTLMLTKGYRVASATLFRFVFFFILLYVQLF